MNSRKPVIILVPRLYNAGGVANFYASIKPFLSNDIIYLYRGKDGKKNKVYRTLLDYYKYIKTIYKKSKQGTVVINHSLGPGSFLRDTLYAFITPGKYKKIIFFRGWDTAFEKKIDKSFFLKKWLKYTFLNSDHIIVLSSSFKLKLIKWGFKQEISTETTLVDEHLLNSESWKSLSDYRNKLKELRLLYLGNISRAKGIWEIVESLNYINNDLSRKIQLTMAGTGVELKALQQYSKEKNLNIKCPGFVTKNKKATIFKNSHLYIFPSNHGEGMPNSVLEAMALGLPIITTKVGGIPDFFEDGKMGLFLDNRNPEHIAEKIQYLFDHPKLMQQMSEYNYNYAKEHFYAGKVARRLKNIIESITNQKNINERTY